MFLKILRAVRRDLCQADEDELLVPNPMFIASEDNDFFVGIQSRRPARYGRVAVIEGMTADDIVASDQAGVLGGTVQGELDEERAEDVRYFIDAISDFEVGGLVATRYSLEDDELSWEIFELEDAQADH